MEIKVVIRNREEDLTEIKKVGERMNDTQKSKST